jgi:hypothetical protein
MKQREKTPALVEMLLLPNFAKAMLPCTHLIKFKTLTQTLSFQLSGLGQGRI